MNHELVIAVLTANAERYEVVESADDHGAVDIFVRNASGQTISHLTYRSNLDSEDATDGRFAVRNSCSYARTVGYVAFATGRYEAVPGDDQIPETVVWRRKPAKSIDDILAELLRRS